jgi:hypothetical protein
LPFRQPEDSMLCSKQPATRHNPKENMHNS